MTDGLTRKAAATVLGIDPADLPDYLSTSAVANALGMTPDNVRRLERTGRLRTGATTSGARRLFRPEDVAAFKIERERAAAQAGGVRRGRPLKATKGGRR